MFKVNDCEPNASLINRILNFKVEYRRKNNMERLPHSNVLLFMTKAYSLSASNQHFDRYIPTICKSSPFVCGVVDTLVNNYLACEEDSRLFSLEEF